MKTPEISIPGFNGYDYSEALPLCDIEKRANIRRALEQTEDGKYYADAHTISCGDSLVLVIRNKRTGQREVYDLKVLAHYMEQMEVCDECQNFIPPHTRSMVNAHHKDSCSLYPHK